MKPVSTVSSIGSAPSGVTGLSSSMYSMNAGDRR